MFKSSSILITTISFLYHVWWKIREYTIRERVIVKESSLEVGYVSLSHGYFFLLKNPIVIYFFHLIINTFTTISHVWLGIYLSCLVFWLLQHKHKSWKLSYSPIFLKTSSSFSFLPGCSIWTNSSRAWTLLKWNF